MMFYGNPNSLRSRVLAFVLAQGQVTNRQVLAGVGHTIPSPQAVAAGRVQLKYEAAKPRGASNPANPIYTVTHLAETGRRQLVNHALRQLTKEGKLRRVRTGLYAPPLPKVYVPDNRAG